MTSKELREKILCSEVLSDKICSKRSKLFCRNETEQKFSNSFAVLIFWYFSIKRKVHLIKRMLLDEAFNES